MSIYSRALRHIDLKDVKKKHHEKLIEKKFQEKIEKEEREYLQKLFENEKYDWRKESKIKLY